MACCVPLEEKGVLTGKFKTPFRKRKEWAFSLDEEILWIGRSEFLGIADVSHLHSLALSGFENIAAAADPCYVMLPNWIKLIFHKKDAKIA